MTEETADEKRDHPDDGRDVDALGRTPTREGVRVHVRNECEHLERAESEEDDPEFVPRRGIQKSQEERGQSDEHEHREDPEVPDA